jgi:hypothetical protein
MHLGPDYGTPARRRDGVGPTPLRSGSGRAVSTSLSKQPGAMHHRSRCGQPSSVIERGFQDGQDSVAVARRLRIPSEPVSAVR